MDTQSSLMGKFDFLVGNWKLEYRVPKSAFSEAATGTGTGTIKRALGDKYVVFDYSASLSNGTSGGAHAIFAWDSRTAVYRYWWFEDSGNFMTATCRFLDDDTLFLNWHDTLLVQTFTKVGSHEVVLRMEHPIAPGKYELILEVIFTREERPVSL